MTVVVDVAKDAVARCDLAVNLDSGVAAREEVVEASDEAVAAIGLGVTAPDAGKATEEKVT